MKAAKHKALPLVTLAVFLAFPSPALGAKQCNVMVAADRFGSGIARGVRAQVCDAVAAHERAEASRGSTPIGGIGSGANAPAPPPEPWCSPRLDRERANDALPIFIENAPCYMYAGLPDDAGPGNGEAAEPIDPAVVLRDRARALAPRPRLRIAPAEIGLTGMETFVWLASPPEPIAADARAGGIVARAAAEPIRYVWRFGDGSVITTTDPGRPWSARRDGSIGHVYETKGRYRISVAVVWEARWRAGGRWMPLGRFRTTSGRAFPVREMITILVPPQD